MSGISHKTTQNTLLTVSVSRLSGRRTRWHRRLGRHPRGRGRSPAMARWASWMHPRGRRSPCSRGTSRVHPRRRGHPGARRRRHSSWRAARTCHASPPSCHHRLLQGQLHRLLRRVVDRRRQWRRCACRHRAPRVLRLRRRTARAPSRRPRQRTSGSLTGPKAQATPGDSEHIVKMKNALIILQSQKKRRHLGL